ncbi:MAG: signal recognition particle-docking protein FtsY [Candidatus Bathyarchaeia archaeon]
MLDRLRKTLSSAVEKLSYRELRADELDEALRDLQLELLGSDVAYVVAEKITGSVKSTLLGTRARRLSDSQVFIREALQRALLEVFNSSGQVDLAALVASKASSRSPYVIVFVGVNGSGKTLTVAKVARFLQGRGFTVALACSDTFRAGAVEQLETLAAQLGVKAVKHRYGGDAAAVAYDAVSYAKAHGIDAVLIDTAGRMQTKKNLMDEMRKIVQVSKPDLVVFVGDALTGNDAVSQAEEFAKAVGIDASILTKIDADAKGGAAISIAYTLKKPILFLGVSQSLDGLKLFNAEEFVASILP